LPSPPGLRSPPGIPPSPEVPPGRPPSPARGWPDPSQWPGRVYERLFEQRIVLAHGELDDEAATSLCAQLLTLDAEADQPIRLEGQGLTARPAPAPTVPGGPRVPRRPAPAPGR